MGLGSDFDGAAVSMEITNAGDMQLLAARLEKKEGFSTEEIEKIFSHKCFPCLPGDPEERPDGWKSR